MPHEMKKIKEYDALPNAIALYNNGNVLIYANESFNKLFDKQKTWIFEELKKYKENKISNSINLNFFSYDSKTIGCIYNNNYNYDLDVDYTIADYVMTVVLNLTKDEVSSDMPSFNDKSFLEYIGCKKGDNVDTFFYLFYEKYMLERKYRELSKDKLLAMYEENNFFYELEFKTKTYQFMNASLFISQDSKTKDIIASFVLNDITNYKRKIIKIHEEKNNLLKTIAHSFIFIGNLNLMNGNISYLVNNDSEIKKFKRYSDFLDNLREVIYYYDKNKAKKLLSIKNIIKNQRKVSFSVHHIYNDEYRLMEYNILPVLNTKYNALICYKDITNEFESNNIIAKLSNKYEISLIIDLTHNSYHSLSKNTLDNLSFDDYINEMIINNCFGDTKIVKEFFKIENIQQNLKNKQSISIKFQLKSNNLIKWYQAFIILNNKIGNKVVSAILLITDINENFICEENNKKILNDAFTSATNASQAKTVFLSRMSHDLRTPLNAITGITDLMLMKDYLHNEEKNNLKIIRESSSHLLKLINEMLDLSRIENGKLVLVNDNIVLTELLSEIVGVAQGLALKQNIKFEYDFVNIKQNYIKTDSKRLKQIIFNVISNAIKYNKPNGKVLFRVIGEDNIAYDEAKLNFIVEDSGIGMTTEFLNNIFEPFNRESEEREGTGIGLTITKSLVDLLGGEIKISSETNEGTKVILSFSFKINKEIIESKKNQIDNNTNLLGKKILLVEDNLINMEIATQIITKTGASVDSAYDGDEALELFNTNSYDLIFMDIQMPKKNGYETTKIIRQKNQTVPIIGMSANAFCDDILKGKACGMTNYLSKPVEAKKIVEAIIKYT